ncbi:MAG: protein translocase subunit SecF [Gammaproteobacteria bacterium]
MEFFTKPLNIDWMSKRKLAAVISGTLTVISIASLVVQGLNLGIDFTGGTLVEIGFSRPADLDQVREKLGSAEFKGVSVQRFGSSHDILVRVAPREELSSAELSNRILSLVPEAEMRRVEFVGPQVGEDLRDKGGLAMIIALVAILIYVALRFESRFAIGAVIALMHDVLLVVGVFSLFQREFDLSVLAAVLAVIGYSLNDTIVVYDRMRENFRKMRRESTLAIVNVSLSQTLSRTLMTGISTLLVLIALYALAGEMLRPFSFALIVGLIFGTYSSVYVASALALALGVSRKDLLPVAKEGVADDRP